MGKTNRESRRVRGEIRNQMALPTTRMSLRLASSMALTAKATTPSRFRSFGQIASCALVHTSAVNRKTFEPNYLDAAGLTPPAHPKVNIQLKGFDFDVLESYQSYVHNMAENIGIDVGESWATPCESFKAHTYAAQSTKVNNTYTLNVFERNVQLDNVLSTDLPVLIDVLRKTLPEGASLSVHEHADQDYEARFIPDPLINSLRDELQVIETARNAALEEKRAERAAKAAKK